MRPDITQIANGQQILPQANRQDVYIPHRRLPSESEKYRPTNPQNIKNVRRIHGAAAEILTTDNAKEYL